MKTKYDIYVSYGKEYKSKETAYMRLLFFGLFGAHWFYLGNKLKGFLQLILGIISICWCFVMIPLSYFLLAMSLGSSTGYESLIEIMPYYIIFSLLGLGPFTPLFIWLLIDLFHLSKYVNNLNNDVWVPEKKDYTGNHIDIVNPTTKTETKLSSENAEQYFIESEVKKVSKDSSDAYLLLLFLGCFGGHWFYLGNKTWGMLQLSLCILGVNLSFWGYRLTYQTRILSRILGTDLDVTGYDLLLKAMVIVGPLVLVALVIWLIIDLFKLSKYVENLNNDIRESVTEYYMSND